MHITLPKRALDKMTEEELSTIDRTLHDIRGARSIDVDLLKLDDEAIRGLLQALERVTREHKTNTTSMVNDIHRWLRLVREGLDGKERPRTVRQFADLVTQYIAASPGHRIYQRQRGGIWLAHYVNHIDYESERSGRDVYRPASASINTLYWRLGEQLEYSITFKQSDIDGRTIAEAMAAMGLTIETDDLRQQYLQDRKKFQSVFNAIGRQFITRGHGYELSRQAVRNPVRLNTAGEYVKVVVDIVGNTGEDSARRARVSPYFWRGTRPRANQQVRSDDLGINDAIIDGKPPGEDPHNPEVPIHPYVPVFHLGRHKRYRVHVASLEEYQFNTNLGDQLVLPEITKKLVGVLVNQGKVAFRDIIDGKGGGACILLGGPPGVGKTLTAEVFAEATKRPLLSVQAAQLGISPDEIEVHLQNVLIRGNRWNAVVLLDEAHVYIRERAGDLSQNAIVAAFLRVLENHAATIFMTTNRLDQVDDAIASRRLARIDFALPDPQDQKQIWKILNANNDAGLSEEMIEQIVGAALRLIGARHQTNPETSITLGRRQGRTDHGGNHRLRRNVHADQKRARLFSLNSRICLAVLTHPAPKHRPATAYVS